ncbi:MAG: pyrroline-5-carboxylate reductase [Nannocystis sp.]|nr:pyrroline-5-carboxylate reductase [Nannocystis sp.]MBA3549211.1 pyrroline-5-carboxylate reductase [Nannocystis sp.]
MTDPRQLAVIGCGIMGEAIVGGLLRTGLLGAREVIATARRQDVADVLAERHGIITTVDNLVACSTAETVLLTLKPQRIAKVIHQPGIREALAGKLVVSIAAGVTLTQLATWLPQSAVIRAMPNTPCLIGEGMTVLARGPGVGDREVATVSRLFETVGRCIEVEDKLMDAVTSLGGSGPAFVYVMIEAMADGGVMMGLPRPVALQIAAQVFQGAARMVLQTSRHPAALKDQVTTPAGCTIAGILTMEDGRIRSVLARTIQEATRVAGELGKDAAADR